MSRPSDPRRTRAIVLMFAAPLALAGAACAGTDTSDDTPILFDDPHREGARLTVVDFGDDTLGVSVTAPIGTPVPAGRDLLLVDLYRLLHPEDAVVPAELAPLSARVEAWARDRALRSDTAPPAATATPEPAPVAIDKGMAEFYAWACITFEVFDQRFTPWQCIWKASQSSVTLPKPAPAGCTGWGCYPITYDDRTFVWNENSYTTRLLWFNPAGDNRAWTIPATNWGWYNVSGPGVQTWAANLSTYPHNVNGTIGLTWHNRTFIQPR